MSTGSELSRWVDYAAEVSREPVSAFPTLSLLDLLFETYDATVEWTGLQADGRLDWVFLHPPASWPPPGTIEYVLAHLDEHPLIRWYGHTRGTEPMTIGRVPEAVADRRLVDAARDRLGSPEMAQELALPVFFSGRRHGVFTVSRGGRDFTPEEFGLACQLQPLLMVLDRQATLSSQLGECVARRFELTGREAAVLCPLRRGLTIPAIARQLSSSPRTVEKHLEHVYRKMGVRDRLGAVRAAEAHDRATDTQPSRIWPGSSQFGTQAESLRGRARRTDVLVMSGTLASREPVYPSHALRP